MKAIFHIQKIEDIDYAINVLKKIREAYLK